MEANDIYNKIITYLEDHKVDAALIHRFKQFTVHELNQYFKNTILIYCPNRESAWTMYLMIKNILPTYLPTNVSVPELNQKQLETLYEFAIQLSNCLDQ